MRKDHDRGNKGGGGGERKTETTNEFLSVKFDNKLQKVCQRAGLFEWKDQEPT